MGFERNRITKVPKDLRNVTLLLVIASGFTTIIFDMFAFLLQISKNAFAEGRVYLGVVCIAVYYAQNVAQASISLFMSALKNQQIELREIHIDTNAANTLTKVRNRVFLNEGDVMSSSHVLSSIKNYLEGIWDFYMALPGDIINCISTIITFCGFLIVSTIEIQNIHLFILVIVTISILSVFFSNMRVKQTSQVLTANKKLYEEENELKNDILNIEPQDEKHSNYMIESYMEVMKKSFAHSKNGWNKTNQISWYEALFNTVATFFIIGIKIYEVGGIEKVTLETVLTIIAIQTIYSQIISKINSQIRSVERYRGRKQKIKTYEPDAKLIFEVLKEQDDMVYSNVVEVEVPKFEVEYANCEKRYKLSNKQGFKLHTGECLMLTGASGSGKTTFMRLITGKVKFKNTSFDDIMSVMHFADTKLGSRDVLNELILGDTLDEAKLIHILKGVQLYEKLYAKNSDVIAYLRDTKAINYSNGERQRLLITRLLYNLEANVELVVLDEVTNALDDGIAEKVVDFIREYCKNKLIIVATHQTDIWKKVATKHFDFVGTDGKYEMIEQ